MSNLFTRNWREAVAVYGNSRVMGMSFLGFSAGLPFLLVFSTLSAWLRDSGVELTTIGFVSWIGITYSIKFIWAPVIDRLALPILTIHMGKRRSWMLLAQLCIAGGLVGMSLGNPLVNLEQIILFALLVAFGSATQDITIDAYRIEALGSEYQGAMAASYVFGYRIALLIAGAGAFYLAAYESWSYAYMVMAALMLVGIFTTLTIHEPVHVSDKTTRYLEEKLEQSIGLSNMESVSERIIAWFVDAVLTPFVEFFQRNGRMAIVILMLIGCYRISDITMGVMANPFYLDKGFDLTDIANVTKIFGFFMTILGAGIGGIFVIRYGIMRPLLAGAIMVSLTNLFFVWLASSETSIVSLAVVVSADNFSGGFATSAFIAYLSNLTSKSYTATQYALFSSLMTLPAKFLGGYSGLIVDHIGYANFFLYAGLIGVPAILLVIIVNKYTKQPIIKENNTTQ